jgi:hypothetical protein
LILKFFKGQELEVLRFWKLARVNQPPWLHQLAVLSIGWAGWFASFSFTSLPYVNQHSTTVNLFWLLTFDHLFFIAIFFSTLTSILPTHLATILS